MSKSVNDDVKKVKNKREWVKNALIVFLVIMLILTFFSNTIMNYSLPEVATQYVMGGSITAKIRGTGTVISDDPYEVSIKESRKVMSIAVKEGDSVEKGDVLIYLEETESEELKAAMEALEDAQEAYDRSLLSADITSGIIQQAGTDTSVATYRQQITAAQQAVSDAQKTVDEWQKKYDSYETQIASVPSNTADTTKEQKDYDKAKKAKEKADFALTEAQNKYDSICAQLNYEISVSSGDDVISNLTTQKQEAELALISAQTAYKDAELAFSKAETALNNKLASGDTTGTVESLRLQQAAVETSLNSAKDVLSQKQTALDTLLGDINSTLNLQESYQKVVDAQTAVSEELEKTQSSTITASISGTVEKINIRSGQTTIPDDAMLTIQPEGKGYTMSFSVTSEQAKRLSVGDKADLVNAWYYNDVDITLTGIKNDPQNPGKNKLLTFSVVGDVMDGQSLSVSVGQKSANYDLIVPNSAIREDNNGKFILIVESKSSPLGNRYIATRVDVEVIASDETQSAITAALYGYEFVITTSNKPVEAGKQVRLSEN